VGKKAMLFGKGHFDGLGELDTRWREGGREGGKGGENAPRHIEQSREGLPGAPPSLRK